MQTVCRETDSLCSAHFHRQEHERMVEMLGLTEDHISFFLPGHKKSEHNPSSMIPDK